MKKGTYIKLTGYEFVKMGIGGLIVKLEADVQPDGSSYMCFIYSFLRGEELLTFSGRHADNKSPEYIGGYDFRVLGDRELKLYERLLELDEVISERFNRVHDYNYNASSIEALNSLSRAGELLLKISDKIKEI